MNAYVDGARLGHFKPVFSIRKYLHDCSYCLSSINSSTAIKPGAAECECGLQKSICRSAEDRSSVKKACQVGHPYILCVEVGSSGGANSANTAPVLAAQILDAAVCYWSALSHTMCSTTHPGC